MDKSYRERPYINQMPTSININLNVNARTPDEIIKRLIELTEERTIWRKRVRDNMAVKC